ncbi:PREDICTED: non-specific lipid-transfer protein 1-like [Nelumbo nucifera]|uniref:Non-specific lipid-transfer protein n=2 Tax=Nelumbo nucifera TaxID=4432 RepID=A0A822Y3I7_NELNU|nr:PREDICTED: non-specific lipid-transfer protein 1-like [Nelumbo nucifera]DAD25796.1 TPA_asm: hypothetical protein HUJ06_027264 [Nelumbo nucifera]
MARSGMLKVVFIIMVVVVGVDAGISCGQVTSQLAPCITYLVRGGAVSPLCCRGVRGLSASARTTRDRRTACGCIKSASAGIRGLKLALAASLPGRCRVRIPYKISPSTDCSRVR